MVARRLALGGFVVIGTLACSSSDPASPAPASDGGVDAASGGADGGDGGAADASDGGARDALVEGGGSGKDCNFNKDCPASERCECDETTGCFCHTGARGTGKNGVDTCKTGNDCASALCVEGPADGGGVYYCSDECNGPSDCKGALPLCSSIAPLGKICVRQP